MRLYVDSSAFIKLIHLENESASLISFLPKNLFTSIITKLEIHRFLSHRSSTVGLFKFAMEEAISLISIDDHLVQLSLSLNLPRYVRTLDSLHIGTAMSMVNSIDGVVTYDRKMQKACEILGLKFFAPGQN